LGIKRLGRKTLESSKAGNSLEVKKMKLGLEDRRCKRPSFDRQSVQKGLIHYLETWTQRIKFKVKFRFCWNITAAEGAVRISIGDAI
jgi:hypothetical protein